MKRAVIYARVSTEEQGEGTSLHTQTAACRAHAEARGYSVIGEFSDMYSGTDLEGRPELNRLFNFIEVNSADVVIAYDVDRLTREMGDLVLIERRIEKRGAAVEYVRGGYGNDEFGKMVKMLKAMMAKNENLDRAERSRRGKRAVVANGYVMCPAGRAPFGYDYIPGKRQGRFEINEEQAHVVRLIYSWLIEDGLSSYAIARLLWEQGILSKGDISEVVVKKSGRGEWSPTTVRKIISNPVYKGVWSYGKTSTKKVDGKYVTTHHPESEWVTTSVPAIVDDATWDAAQVCLARNKQNAKRNTRREYLLRSMVFCPCGRRWTVVYKTHLQRAYYRCPSNEAEYWRHKCDYRFSIRQEWLESTVWNAVVNQLLNPDDLQAEIDLQREEVLAEIERNQEKQAEIKAAMSDIDRRLGILLDQMLDGTFPRELIAERKQGLENKRRNLEGDLMRLQRMANMPVLTLDQQEQLTEFAYRLHENLCNFTQADKRRVLEMLELRVDVITRDQVKISGIISDGLVVDISTA